MIYPETDPKEWELKHGVPCNQSICRKCGEHVWIDIPIISKDFVGFESKEHQPCGRQFVITIVKIRPKSPLVIR